MSRTFDYVKLGELVWEDEAFAIRSFTCRDRLDQSLRRWGVLQPPWIWVKPDGGKVIVDGFKRLRWAREAGFGRVECLLFPPDYDPAGLLVERIEARLFGSPLNVAEKAQVIAKLARTVPQETLLRRYLPHLGVAARPEAVSGWCRLAASGGDLLEAAAGQVIAERAALELANWEREPQAAMLALLKKLRCSASIQMEVLERVQEIALREETSTQRVLADPELGGIMGDAGRNHREKTQALRAWLDRRRYPRMKAREERFLRDLAACRLPGEVRVLPPPAFEGRSWQVQLQFTNPEELQRVLADLQGFASSTGLRQMMRD